jgi:hypothetical protein
MCSLICYRLFGENNCLHLQSRSITTPKITVDIFIAPTASDLNRFRHCVTNHGVNVLLTGFGTNLMMKIWLLCMKGIPGWRERKIWSLQDFKDVKKGKYLPSNYSHFLRKSRRRCPGLVAGRRTQTMTGAAGPVAGPDHLTAITGWGVQSTAQYFSLCSQWGDNSAWS